MKYCLEKQAVTLDDIFKERCRRSILYYINALWRYKNNSYKIGIHTRSICEKIDQALERFRNGICSYIALQVPYRHGKSEISSIYLPSKFIGEFPDEEVIVTSHRQDKAREFSRKCRALVREEKYKLAFPGIDISSEASNVDDWTLKNYSGGTHWRSIKSLGVGIGGALAVLDDFFSGREEAESGTIREKVFEAITSDLMTRLAPVHIVIILATPWHVDDPFGRIKKRMKEDRDFPQFEFVKFPARSDDYETGYLFPERYSEEWYCTQFATLSKYEAAGLLQCDPQIRGGNVLPVDGIKIVEDFDEFKRQANIINGVVWGRAWDLASSEKQTQKSDPDYTVGVRGCVAKIASGINGVDADLVYVDDVIKGRWEATRRNEKIKSAAIQDGNIKIGIEAFAAYKDAYTQLRDVLKGIRSVRKINLPGDKITKADRIEPIMRAGNLYLKRAPWNDDFINVLSQFSGSGSVHDDDVDALVCLHALCSRVGITENLTTNFIT